MATRTVDRGISRIGFVADNGYDRGPSRQIDWDNVSSDFEEADGSKYLPAGTVLSPQGDGTAIPRADGAADSGAEILTSGARLGSETDALTGYGTIVGGVVYENLLPDFSNADFATFKAELEDAGTGFVWRSYADSRA